uniref:Ulp1 protease-like n=1 Tax=Oryza sativa subsp. japonica TaxID=39947 RepID=Q6H6N6_ORYSJ|nr:ulp1 protease-like [Oryza sativa Japonica Group]BAD25613.1 ulp1 protease-like [Oryza sativa Japonica Group]
MWRFSHYFHFKWSSYDYCLVLDQRCSDSPITPASTKLISGAQDCQVFYPEIPYHKRHLALKPILLSLYAVLTRPPRNLRELRLGTPRANKALSDPSETKDHVRSGRAGQRSKSPVIRERFSDDKAGS